jgi:hypothetical protein
MSGNEPPIKLSRPPENKLIESNGGAIKVVGATWAMVAKLCGLDEAALERVKNYVPRGLGIFLLPFASRIFVVQTGNGHECRVACAP